MTISFDSIPVGIRTQGVYVEVSSARAVQGTPAIPHVALIIGMRLAGGTVAASVPTLIPSGADADTYWGRGSYLANMCRAFKALNTYTELWAIGVDEGAGIVGTQTLEFTGPATEDGTVAVYVEGRRVAVSVSSADADTVIAAAVEAALDLETDLSMTFDVAAAVITATARHKGIPGNDIDIRHSYLTGESLPAGVGLTIATGVTGTLEASIAAAIAAMGDVQYHTIVCGFADDTNLDLLETELDDRWGYAVQKPGMNFVGFVGTPGDTTSYGTARNSKHTTAMAAGLSPAPAWLWAALVGARDALETDPARPRQTLALTPAVTRYFAPAPADRFTQPERQIILYDGMATHVVDDGGIVRIERLITTYQTNALGTVDPSYLDLTTVRTLTYLRYSLRARIQLRYPRHKLAANGTRFSPGQAVVTPDMAKATGLALFAEWETEGLVEDYAQFQDEVIFEINANDPNRLDCRLGPNIVNQFRVMAAQLQYLL